MYTESIFPGQTFTVLHLNEEDCATLNQNINDAVAHVAQDPLQFTGFYKTTNVASLGENPFGEHCMEVD